MRRSQAAADDCGGDQSRRIFNKESRLMLIACLCGRRHFVSSVTPAVDVLFCQDVLALAAL